MSSMQIYLSALVILGMLMVCFGLRMFVEGVRDFWQGRDGENSFVLCLMGTILGSAGVYVIVVCVGYWHG